MIEISERGRLMPPSPIRKLVPFAEAAKKRSVKVYHLNIGQPDIETPKLMLDAFHNLDVKVIEYGHSAGLESYRRKLAGYYQKNGIMVNYDDIIVTTGGSEALIFALLATMNPGDEIIIPEPFYTNYNSFAIHSGVKVVPITSHIEDNFALPPIKEFEKLIGPKTKAIMINNPGNPTGYIYSRAELEELRDLVKKHNLFLLSDEVYREFTYDGEEYVSVMHLDGIDQQTVILDSVSKRYSACGARVGAILSKNKAVIDAALRLGQARLCPPTVEQMAAEAAVDTPQSYFDEVVAEYDKRRQIVYNGLSSIEGVTCSKPKGAFYMIAKLPVNDADHFCRWLLESFSHKNQTVMLAPANGFYATPGLGKSEVRIAYVLKGDDLHNAIDCLKVALAEYPNP
ncbi:MAG: pyridoxal phosphate-dependent aminotransferase [Calditrichaeota bacterium]|nr:pyridoxal phosphate-dependent aminotransferase [Calditrichota bacterium]